MYLLIRNGRHPFSTHRTLRGAVRAYARAQRECRDANGANTWLDLAIRRDDGSQIGAPLTRSELDEREAQFAALDAERWAL